MTNLWSIKPLGRKAYGSIPHLHGSRTGAGDHFISKIQGDIATVNTRNKKRVVIAQEKLDGANVAAAKHHGKIIPIIRDGYYCESSQYINHHVFIEYVKENEERFDRLLNDGERLCGEFLAQATGTRYNLPHEPFVPFDIYLRKDPHKQYEIREPYLNFEKRVKEFDFTVPKLLHIGDSFSIESAIDAIKTSGHGAIDDVEGAIWRVENDGQVEFLCKFVHHFKQDGKYLPLISGKEEIWNMDVSWWLEKIKQNGKDF